jgi:hypothetical protein
MRGVILALLLGGLSFNASSGDSLSEKEIQRIMQVIDDEAMFSTLTVCISGKCTAAFECGMAPSLVEYPSGAVRVFTDCGDNFPEFVCANGVKLKPGDWCQLNYANGKIFRLTLFKDGFKVEEDL